MQDKKSKCNSLCPAAPPLVCDRHYHAGCQYYTHPVSEWLMSSGDLIEPSITTSWAWFVPPHLERETLESERERGGWLSGIEESGLTAYTILKHLDRGCSE